MPEHRLSTEIELTKRRGRPTSNASLDIGRSFHEVSRASPPDDITIPVEITRAHELRLGDRLARGGYSDVHKGTMIQPGGTDLCQVAVKILRCNGMIHSPQETLIRIDKRLGRELDVWRRLKHRRITPLLAFATSSSRVIPGGGAVLVSPYREKANLRTYLSKEPNADKLLLLQQACEGLNHMHTFEPPIAHLDLKPENILINDNGEAELCDFGLAKALEDACTGFTTSNFGAAATLIYTSPEALNAESQTTESDIYAMGGVILPVMSGVPPWGQTPFFKIIRKVSRGKTPSREEHPISECDPPIVDEIWLLMQWCWLLNPLDRPKAFEVLKTLTNLRNPGSTTAPLDLRISFESPHREGTTSDSLNDATSYLISRDDEMAGHEDLSAIIERRRRLLNIRPPGHPQRDESLHLLGSALESRYHQDENPDDLSAAIEHYREGLNLRPSSHPQPYLSLHLLGSAFDFRYYLDRNPDDLKAAIRHHQEAVDLCPSDNPTRHKFLRLLAFALESRFNLDNDTNDLSAAIKYLEEALSLRPPGHLQRHEALHDLGSLLKSRFDRDENPDDLGTAIKHYEEAANLCPPDHSDRAWELHDLGTALKSRYNLDGDPDDLAAAIKHLRETLSLYPLGHPQRRELPHDLRSLLKSRFDRNKKPDDLGAAINHFQEAVDLCPPGHSDRAQRLYHLGSTLRSRYTLCNDYGDLSAAIKHLEEALSLQPPGHPQRYQSLHGLGSLLKSRFDRNKDPDDIGAAIKHFTETLSLCPPGNPNHSLARRSLEAARNARRKMAVERRRRSKVPYHLNP